MLALDTGRVPKGQPLDRLLAVLESVVEAARPIALTEIAVACQLPLPTVHRLALQLEARGLLKRLLGTRKWVAGAGLVRLSLATLEAAVRADLPHRILVALANQIGEHCQIGVRVDNSVDYIDAVHVPRAQGLLFDPGQRAPLHCTSIGKVILSQFSDEEFDWWLAHTDLPAMTAKTIVTPRKLKQLIGVVRSEGWATSDEELIAGVVGCAVPIRSETGQFIAGLGVAAPSARIAFSQLHRFRGPLETAAAEMAAALPLEQ